MNVWRQLRELTRSVRVLFAATLINRCGTMVLPYLALYIAQGLGAGGEAAGTVLAASVWGPSSPLWRRGGSPIAWEPWP